MQNKGIKILIFFIIILGACFIEKLGFINHAYAVHVQDATGSAAAMPNPEKSTIYSCQGSMGYKSFSTWAQLESYYVSLGYRLNTSATANGDWSQITCYRRNSILAIFNEKWKELLCIS